MLKIDVLNHDGKNLRTLDLSEEVFGVEVNNQAVFDAIVNQQLSVRAGTHDVKNRGEVRGGGRKPWRQKGTGRARTGSIRIPHWRGGGVVFGPTPRKYGFKLNRKVRKLALCSALSQKVLDSEMLVVENLTFDTIKTKDFIKFASNLDLNRKTLFVVSNDEDVDNAYYSMRNVQGNIILNLEGLNVYDIVNSNRIVFTEKAAIEAAEVFA
jgi:large subunit ribosomal protein L4